MADNMIPRILKTLSPTELEGNYVFLIFMHSNNGCIEINGALKSGMLCSALNNFSVKNFHCLHF